MSRWRREALKRLPQLQKVIAEADSVMALWIELRCEFEKAYRRDPPDEETVAGIYAYADWCIQAPRRPDAGHDPCSAVIVCLQEDIPAIRPARDDMPRWFKYSEIADNPSVFGYSISTEAFQSLLRHMDKNRHRYQPRASLDC